MNYDKLASQLYFSKEAAEYLSISVQRLNKLVHDQKIRPLKKNASGTIFHIDELKQRKEELMIFDEQKKGGSNGMFLVDNRTKQEALNYATLMNLLNYTENRLEPLFNDIAKLIDVTKPMVDNDVIKEYSHFFNIGIDSIFAEYTQAKKAFSRLKPTDEIIKRGSQDYPPLLAETEQAPRFLYIRGRKALLYEKRTVALVGSRNASETAKDNTKRLAETLGKNGITVVSGLAKGIDVTAHISALTKGYNTIAVIGTNLNQYYPKENKEIQLEIEKRGLVVSQFSPASKTQRWFFPLRNGVMSGLSLATVIMEAGETSGALKQADFALKQGRLILIPEKSLHIQTISWPAKYVQKGAQIVKTPLDIVSKLSESKIFKNQPDEVYEQVNLDEYLSSDHTGKSNINSVTKTVSL